MPRTAPPSFLASRDLCEMIAAQLETDAAPRPGADGPEDLTPNERTWRQVLRRIGAELRAYHGPAPEEPSP